MSPKHAKRFIYVKQFTVWKRNCTEVLFMQVGCENICKIYRKIPVSEMWKAVSEFTILKEKGS